jgi:hypothetical protein
MSESAVGSDVHIALKIQNPTECSAFGLAGSRQGGPLCTGVTDRLAPIGDSSGHDQHHPQPHMIEVTSRPWSPFFFSLEGY